MPKQTLNERLAGLRKAENQTILTKTADASLGVQENIVHATIPAAGSITLTLPPCGMSKGSVFFIRVAATGGGTSVIVQDLDDSYSGGHYKRELRNVGDQVLLINPAGEGYVEVPIDYGERVAKVPLAAVDTAGGVVSWQNPESVNVAIEKLLLHVTTASTGACTVDGGTTAASATTSSDNLIDGLDVNSAAGLFSNLLNPGTNGKAHQLLASGKWVTLSVASGASAGIVGFAYIVYRRLT